MKLAIPAETTDGEARVAASPDTVKAYVKKGLEVLVEAGAGAGSNISDEAYAAAGASLYESANQTTAEPGDQPAGADAGAKPDDVVEADYEIVDDSKK